MCRGASPASAVTEGVVRCPRLPPPRCAAPATVPPCGARKTLRACADPRVFRPPPFCPLRGHFPRRGRQGRAAQSPPRLEGGGRAKRGRGDPGAEEEAVSPSPPRSARATAPFRQGGHRRATAGRPYGTRAYFPILLQQTESSTASTSLSLSAPLMWPQR